MEPESDTVNWNTKRKGPNGRIQVQVRCPICDALRWCVATQVRFEIKKGKWTGRCYEHRNVHPERACVIDGCTDPFYGKEWCYRHWQRWRRTGDPLMVRVAGPNSGSFKKGQVPHNKGVPMTAEQRRRISQARLGKPAWNKGMTWPEEYRAKRRGEKRSEETRQRIREARAQQVITPEHRAAISRSLSGRTLSPEHVAKISGPNSWRWKGGVAKRSLGTKAWRTVRDATYRRDGYRCQRCGESNRRKLVAHHIIEYPDGPDTLDNLITLCRSCHARHHSTKKAA